MQQIVFVGFFTVFYIGILVLKCLRGKNVFDIRFQITKFILAEYLFCVLAVTLLPIYIQLGEPVQWSDTTINFIPFHFVKDYTQLIEMDSFYLKVAVKNLLGNVVLFVPFGFLVPIVYEKFQSAKNVVWLSAVCSGLIELIQLVEMNFGLAFRMTDIDDIILNVLGSIIGYYLYRICSLRRFFVK